MAVCVDFNNAKKLFEVVNQTEITCTAYLLQTAVEYRSFDLAAIYAQYFDVDLSIFELVMGAYFVAFVSGHVLGRIVSGLRKAG